MRFISCRSETSLFSVQIYVLLLRTRSVKLLMYENMATKEFLKLFTIKAKPSCVVLIELLRFNKQREAPGFFGHRITRSGEWSIFGS